MAGTHAPTTGYADVHGARLYYEEMGAGQSLVLIHAGIADCRMWDDQFAAFAERYRVVRYDIRGFGKSAMPPGPSSTYRDLHGLLQYLNIHRAALIGLSIGGGIAIDFALQHPEITGALVLAASGLGGSTGSPEMAAQYAEIDAVLAREGVPAAVECESRLWVDGPRRTPDQVDASVRERVRIMNTAISLQPEEVGTRERLDPPAITRLGEITAPTLVVVGDGDVPDVIATADLLASRIAGARKVILPDVAHMLTMERPDTFNRLVLDFLDEQYH